MFVFQLSKLCQFRQDTCLFLGSLKYVLLDRIKLLKFLGCKTILGCKKGTPIKKNISPA